MAINPHLHFRSDVVKEKNHYQGHQSACPFCDRKELSEILDEEGSVLLVKNKFSTLEHAFQAVIIETHDCSANIATYTKEHFRNIITFGINHWLKMEESGAFKSVVFFKNHGPLSGGSIDHAHMQLVGLEDIDYKLNINDAMFEGIEIYSERKNLLNISTKPKTCPIEFNVIVTPRHDPFMADAIQNAVKYILGQNGSFNLFFYQWKDSIVCKIVPRYVASPFLMGFSIPQTSSRLNSIAEEFKSTYYPG